MIPPHQLCWDATLTHRESPGILRELSPEPAGEALGILAHCAHRHQQSTVHLWDSASENDAMNRTEECWLSKELREEGSGIPEGWRKEGKRDGRKGGKKGRGPLIAIMCSWLCHVLPEFSPSAHLSSATLTSCWAGLILASPVRTQRLWELVTSPVSHQMWVLLQPPDDSWVSCYP